MKNIRDIVNTVFKSVGLAMGVASVVLIQLNKIDINSALTLLSIGVTALGLSLFTNKKV